MRKLKVGFIGCGGIAEDKHMRALAHLSDRFEMLGFSDTNVDRAALMCERFGAPGAKAYTDYHNMLEDERIDVVHVCTPNDRHAQNAIDSLRAGKHVMCEKPMANTPEAAQAMLEAARAGKRKLSVSYQYRFREDSIFLKRAASEGMLGSITHVTAQALHRKNVPTWGCFLNKAAQGGGPLIDAGTHALDLAMWMLGDYDVSYVVGNAYRKLNERPEGNLWGKWDSRKFEVEDSAFGFIRMKSGATILLETAWALNISENRNQLVTLCGSEGCAEQIEIAPMRYSWRINRLVNGMRSSIVPNLPSEYIFDRTMTHELTVEAPQKEMLAWHSAIVEDREPLVTAEQGLMVSRVLDAIYKASEAQRPVWLE